jgi:hypothetical protein
MLFGFAPLCKIANLIIGVLALQLHTIKVSFSMAILTWHACGMLVDVLVWAYWAHLVVAC